MLSKQRKELLIYGYTRQNYTKSTVPNEIISSFIKWYNNTFTISFQQDSLEQFYAAAKKDYGERVNSYEIYLTEEISAIMSLWSRNIHNSAITLAFQSSNEKIKYMHCYFQCRYENIPNSTLKGTAKCERYGENGYWGTIQEIIPFSLLRNKSKITFQIDAELIGYTLIDHPNKMIYHGKSPTFDKHIDYEWILTGKELTDFKNTIKEERVCSPNFMNECIGLMIQPKGWNVTVESVVCIWLKFYKWPHGIRRLHLHFKLNANNWIHDEIICVGIDRHYSKSYRIDPYDVPLTIWENVTDKLKISVTLDIKKIFVKNKDDESVELDETEWNNYNVF